MLRLALRNLGTRKLRLVLTALAILIGVAMISATYVYTDSINRAFDQIFKDATAGTDVVVTGRNVFGSGDGHGAQAIPESLPQSYVQRVARVPGTKLAAGQIADLAQVIGKNGKPIKTGGSPTLAFSVLPQPFSPLSVVAGKLPTGSDQVALDSTVAKKAGASIGSTVSIVTDQPLERFKVSGIVRYGSSGSSLGGATITTFTLPAAQALFSKQHEVDTIVAAAEPGVSQQQLATRVKAALPSGVEVKTGTQEAQDQTDQITENLSFLTTALLVFGFVALFVGAFIIFNTFSITVAQRTREFAMLRTLGASRRQILGQVFAEALFIGSLSSVAGLFAGVGLAQGINALFKSADIDLPQAGLTLEPRTVVAALAVGIVVSLVASMVPARRATRVPPIAALHEGAVLVHRHPWRRWTLATLLLLGGLALLLVGILGNVGSSDQTLSMLGAGAVAILLGVAIVSPILIRPIAAVLGWPGERLTHATGRIARENAVRNPGRTAITAAALMIGLALITFVASFTAGLQGSVNRVIDKVTTGAFYVQNTDGFSPIPAKVASVVGGVPGVVVATGIRQQPVKLKGSQVSASGVDQRELGKAYALDWVSGSGRTLTDLKPGQALVNDDLAKSKSLKLRDRFSVTTPSGHKASLRVAGIYSDSAYFQDGVIVAARQFEPLFAGSDVVAVLVALKPGQQPNQVQPAINRALKEFPMAESLSRQQFKDKIKDQIGQLLNLLYALLAISVIVSLFGIVNTLVLSIYERTREIGLTRAIGMTQSQVRSVIRQESVITALVGTVLGIAVGIAFAWLISLGLNDNEVIFTVPVGSVLAFFFVGLLAGIVSAILPARRAAKVSVLEALAYE